MEFINKTQSFFYSITAPMDALYDVVETVNDWIDQGLEDETLQPEIDNTLISVYSQIEANLPGSWGKAAFENDSDIALVEYIELFEQALQEWYDANDGEKKSNTKTRFRLPRRIWDEWLEPYLNWKRICTFEDCTIWVTDFTPDQFTLHLDSISTELLEMQRAYILENVGKILK
jgi:hypothetical protein